MQARHILAATVLCASALAASAQTMKPGLWEISTKMSSSSGEMEKAMAEMQKQIAAMPPEQRKKMQEAMGKQGMGMVDGAASGIKMCLTKEMVERNELPAQQNKDCKTTTSPRSGKTMKMSFVCTKPPSSGEGEMTFSSPESYTSKMRINSASQQGKEEKMTVDSTGKWLSGDCGNIKPLNMPKQ